MPSTAERARALYDTLIETFLADGRRDAADACARLAVEQGIWAHPAQRPRHYVAGLPPVPVHDRRRFPVAAYLERNFAAIREEVDRVTDPSAQGFSPVEEPLVGRGAWDQVMFYEAGHRAARSAALFPRTAAILDGLPDSARCAGVAMLSWMHPGTHIVPHCGHTNARLRVHLGIRTPPEPRIRVHDTVLAWRAGECLVFDDSFEHEVWHDGAEPRVVLLVDVFHPALPEPERTALLASRQASEEERARELMRGLGLRRIARNAGDALAVSLDAATQLRLQRHLRDAGIHSLDLDGDGTVRVVAERA